MKTLKPLRFISYASLGLTVVICLFIGVWGLSGLKPLYVVSGSMEPTFYAGDIVLLNTDASMTPTFNEGNVIAFNPTWFTKGTVTHRIAKVEGNMVYTKGDNNTLFDEPSNKDKVLGVLVAKIPYFGWVINKTVLIFSALTSFATGFAESAIEHVREKKARQMRRRLMLARSHMRSRGFENASLYLNGDTLHTHSNGSTHTSSSVKPNPFADSEYTV